MEDQLTRGREIMRLEKPRIQPLTLENSNEDQAKMLKQQQIRGKPANIFLTMANHEKLAKRWLVFGNHILSKSTLDPREREIAILRIGWLCQAGYEWGQHVVIGKAAGMSELAQTPDGQNTKRSSSKLQMNYTATPLSLMRPGWV